MRKRRIEIETGQGWGGGSGNNLPENHVGMELPFPPPLQPSSASLHTQLEDNRQNLTFYFYPSDHIFHLLGLICNVNRSLGPVISLRSAAHLLVRQKKFIFKHTLERT